MSEILKDRAVILKTYDFGESSAVAVALTREHGKIRLLAKGAKNQRSAFLGNLQTGSLGEVVYYYRQDKGLQLLKEITSGYIFDAADGDLEQLCIFQAGLEIIDRSIIEQETDERTFDVLERFLARIRTAVDPWTIFFALEVQLLAIMGHLPSVDMCEQCKKNLADVSLWINPSTGVVTCEDCRREGALLLSRESAALFVRMCSAGLDGIDSVKAKPEVRRELGKLLHHIYMHHVDGYRLPKSLQLLRGGD